MPELPKQPYWECLTAASWETRMRGSSGSIYIVRFGKHHHKNPDVQRDWSCTCKAYQYHSGYCKHIEEVMHLRCGWMQFPDGEEPIEKDGEKRCPKCEGEVTSRLWTV